MLACVAVSQHEFSKEISVVHALFENLPMIRTKPFEGRSLIRRMDVVIVRAQNKILKPLEKTSRDLLVK